MNKLSIVTREAFTSAVAQPVISLLTIVVVAAMVGSTLLTTGQTVGSEDAVLSTIDSAGTRSIIVRGDPGSGLDSTVIDRLENIEGVAWIGAFGPAIDVTNSAFEGGRRAPSRTFWSTDLKFLGVEEWPGLSGNGWASDRSLGLLGMSSAGGSVRTPAGDDLSIVGDILVPDFLSFLEPLVVIPMPPTSPGSIAVLVVIVTSPNLVGPLTPVISGVLGDVDSAQVSITTSENLATLRGLIEGQLGAFGRDLVLVIFGVSAGLVASILFFVVIMRRRDFGRRRALGASQQFVAALLLTQTALLAATGAVFGSVTAAISLYLAGLPQPGLEFFVAISVLATTVAILAAMLPAWIAANRDPIVELRVA